MNLSTIVCASFWWLSAVQPATWGDRITLSNLNKLLIANGISFENIDSKFDQLQKENTESLKLIEQEVKEKHELKDQLEKIQNELTKV